MTTAAQQVMSDKELVPVKDLKFYHKNPRKGDIPAIAESLKENGQFQPIVVQRSTSEVLAGNHTLKAAMSLGWKKIEAVYVDCDDDRAKKIVLAANRTNDLATYDTEVLTEILASLPTATGTGYDDKAVRTLLAGMQDRDADLVKEVMNPHVEINFDGDDTEWDLASQIKGQQQRHDERFGDDGNQSIAGSGTDVEKLRVAESIAQIQYSLEALQEQLFSSSNYWGVPDLRSDMLLDVLPDPIKTWGGQDATPDDGTSTYLWNAGLAASKGMPWDRAITAFFTHDVKFDTWFAEPAFKVAQMLHNGCSRAIVPDTSFWLNDTRFHHLSAAYNAQWLARFMQEAGVKIIPRFMWCDLESIKVGTLGIPKNPPIAAVCMQAIDRKEVEKQMTPEGLRLFVKEIQPDALIVYGGGTARKVVEQAVLPKSLHVVHVPNYADVRRHVVYGGTTGKDLVEKEQRKNLREAKRKGAANGAEVASRAESNDEEAVD